MRLDDVKPADVGRHLATTGETAEGQETDQLVAPLRASRELPLGSLPRHRAPDAIESDSPAVPMPRHRSAKHATP